MVDDRFEWDDEKAAANLRKHGVTFNTAGEAFDDVQAVEWVDDGDYGEERMNLLAMSNGALLHVTFCERGGKIRIISARNAKAKEHHDYYRAQKS
jgi:uncharacterized protein